MSAAIGVVAHRTRITQAWDLAQKVEASYLSVDQGQWGATANHLKVWEFLVKDYDDLGLTEPDNCKHAYADWCVVLEDDAKPCTNFRDQLDAVLKVAPADVVSLYLGTSYPTAWQDFIAHVALNPAHWAITQGSLIHAVGTAVRTELVADMVKWISAGRGLPIDAAISEWCRSKARLVAYTRPSIVDHEDGPTLIDHPDGAGRDMPRHAHTFGTRESWRPTTVLIP